MIDRAVLASRLTTLRAQRAAQGEQLHGLVAALRTTRQACAQLDGAILVLQDVLAVKHSAEEGG